MINRHTYGFNQAKAAITDVERYLSAYAEKILPAESSPYPNHSVYIFNNRLVWEMKTRIGKLVKTLQYGGWMEEMPWSRDETAIIIQSKDSEVDSTTLSRGFVRLPMLSYLITLTPEDFFSLFITISNQKELTYFELSNSDIPPQFDSWFVRYNVGYRINPELADKKWVPRYTIDTVSQLDQTIENQLAAMQYLTVMRDSSIVATPVSMVIALELDWPQYRDHENEDTDYCLTKPDSTSFALLH